MFGFEDMWKFFFSFFLVLPIVTFIHEAGHLFFGKVTGGRVHIHIGSGNRLFQIGPCHIRKLYFWDGWCEYENLKNHTRRHLVAVYLGGPFFTILSMLIVNGLIHTEIIKAYETVITQTEVSLFFKECSKYIHIIFLVLIFLVNNQVKSLV